MKGYRSRSALALVVLATVAVTVAAQRPAADLILSNGKVATVDEAFRFAQAVAVRGDRIVAVGSNQEVESWAGPATRRVDLAGRTMVPGLIDNHLHLMRAGTNWPWEVR
jgi:predicted amidohydrolase YtcJ